MLASCVTDRSADERKDLAHAIFIRLRSQPGLKKTIVEVWQRRCLAAMATSLFKAWVRRALMNQPQRGSFSAASAPRRYKWRCESRRLVGAGAQPITWLGMAGELQRDWARTEKLGEVAQSCWTMPGLSALYLRGSWITKQNPRRASGQKPRLPWR